MIERERIAAEIRRMFDGNAWHGPGVMDVLQGVTAAEAGERTVPGVHTIYELTHHLAAWIGEVQARLAGRAPGNPEDGDFPASGMVVDDAAWRAVRDRLARRQAALLAALETFDAGRLDDPVDPGWNKESGGAVTFYAMLQGIVQHNAYHAGQIMLLRRARELRAP
jgi:uncharacterized damage-inducible protein DinB